MVPIIAAFFIGFIIGKKLSDRKAKHCFKRFSDEMHSQYVELLKQHGIKKDE